MKHARTFPRLVDTEPLDITLAIRADIKARDWGAVHIAGDRQKPIWLPERVRRLWR